MRSGHRPLTTHLAAVAAECLPGIDLSSATISSGESHDVVLVPARAVVRVARTPSAAAALPRRTALLQRLAKLGLPYAVPQPLGEVREVAGSTAVAMTWVGGQMPSPGQGDPTVLRRLLRALADVDVEAISDVLDVPHAYAGGPRWVQVLRDGVMPLLPGRMQDEARRRLDAVVDLPAVAPGLVHGDLAGDNLRVDGAGQVTGILDWDLASPWDPAVDAACLAWFGWPAVRAAADDPTLERARSYYRIFPLEQVAAALLRSADRDVAEVDADVGDAVRRAVSWLDREP